MDSQIYNVPEVDESCVLFTAATGMTAQQMRIDNIANNITRRPMGTKAVRRSDLVTDRSG